MSLEQGNPEKTEILIDWERIRESLFRFAVGVGLIFGLILLLIATIVLIGVGAFALSKLSFVWLLVAAVLIPVGLFVWWLSFHVAVDTLADLGVHLRGSWSWIVLPVAPLLALVSFGISFLAGFGNFVVKPGFVGLSFLLGSVVLVGLFLLLVALVRG